MKKSAKEKVFAFLTAHPTATGPEVAKGAKVNPNTVAGYLAAWRKTQAIAGVNDGGIKVTQAAAAPSVKQGTIHHFVTGSQTAVTVQPNMSTTGAFVLVSIRDTDQEAGTVIVLSPAEARAFAAALNAVGSDKG